MGVILFSGLVSGIQGKLNGSVLSRGRNGNVIYNKARQRKEPTPAQLQVRAGFSASSKYWADLDNLLKADWQTIADANPVPDRFGNLTTLSGFDYFKRMMNLAFPYGTSAALEPVIGTDSPYEHTPVTASAEYSVQDEGYTLEAWAIEFETINDSAVPNTVNVYISLPVPTLGLPYFKTWYLVSQEVVPANEGASATINLSGGPVTMPRGWRSFPGAKHYFKTVALIPAQGEVSVEQIYGFEIEETPEITFPTLTATIFDGTEGECLYSSGDWFYVPAFTIDPYSAGFDGEFEGSLSFKPIQSGSATPDASGWGIERLQTFVGPFYDEYFVLPGPGGDSVNDDLIKDGAPPPYTFPGDPHLPMRVRLRHIASGTYGPYQYFARPIVIV